MFAGQGESNAITSDADTLENESKLKTGGYYQFNPYPTHTSTSSGLYKTSVSYENCAIT